MENGIPDSFSILTPPSIDDEEIVKEQKAIKYLKSEEWKTIKAHFESRKDFYKLYLPNGKTIHDDISAEELGKRWLVASAIIAEIDALISSFEVKGNG